MGSPVKENYLQGPCIDEPIAMVRDVDGNGTIEEKELFFYSKDHLNSVHDLTDYQGKPVQRYNYTAYGKTKIEKTNPDQNAKLVQNPYAYTSREWEQETGDYYVRDRLLNPNSGRFISEDRIRFKGGDNNFFRFVHNNPVLFTDPFGLATETCWAWEGGFPHNYICVDGVCGGQTPADESKKYQLIGGTVPGGNQGGPSSSEGGMCESAPNWGKKHEKCMDNCSMQAIAGGRPGYSLVGGSGKNCKGWVDDTINNCVQKCATAGLK